MDLLLSLLLLGSLGSLCYGGVLQTNEDLTLSKSPPEVVNADQSVRFLTHLQTALKEIDNKLKKHEEKIEQLEKLNQDQTVQIEQLETLNADQAIKLAQNEDKIQDLQKQKQEEQVGFSAGLGGSGYTGPVNEDMTLVYADVFTNTGNAYNSSSGVFTAPIRGLYHFEFFCYVGGGPGTGVKLQKNGEHIIRAEEYQPSGSGTAGNAASLQLDRGDTVFLILGRGARIFDNYNHLSTFSGHLVFLL